MMIGEHGEYKWVERASCELHEVLDAVPELVIDQCVAIASFDSGPLELTPAETAQGWKSRDEVAYIPCVRDVSVLPYALYDEWYILEAERHLGFLSTFVNYSGFSLSGTRGIQEANMHRSDVEPVREAAFWSQLKRVAAVSCVLNGEPFVLVTRDRRVFDAVVQFLSAAGA